MIERHPKDEVCIIGSSYSRRFGDMSLLPPGSVVCHRDCDKSSYGMIIACDDVIVTVLWSVPPQPSVFVGFKKLALPISRGMNYGKLASQIFKVEHMPSGAHTYYAKDEEDEPA